MKNKATIPSLILAEAILIFLGPQYAKSSSS